MTASFQAPVSRSWLSSRETVKPLLVLGVLGRKVVAVHVRADPAARPLLRDAVPGENRGVSDVGPALLNQPSEGDQGVRDHFLHRLLLAAWRKLRESVTGLADNRR